MDGEGTVSTGNVLAGGLWLVVLVTMSTAWAVMLINPDAWRVAGMLGLTSAAMSGVAAVFHMRNYYIRIARLIRATADARETGWQGNGGTGGTGLHRVP